jgi:hypothetical protein
VTGSLAERAIGLQTLSMSAVRERREVARYPASRDATRANLAVVAGGRARNGSVLMPPPDALVLAQSEIGRGMPRSASLKT